MNGDEAIPCAHALMSGSVHVRPFKSVYCLLNLPFSPVAVEECTSDNMWSWVCKGSGYYSLVNTPFSLVAVQDCAPSNCSHWIGVITAW